MFNGNRAEWERRAREMTAQHATPAGNDNSKPAEERKEGLVEVEVSAQQSGE